VATSSDRPKSSDRELSIDLRKLERLEQGEHYLDSFLGEMKRQANIGLIRRWADHNQPQGRVLKTDLFEEAFGPDAILGDLAEMGTMAVGIDESLAVAARAHFRQTATNAHAVVADVRQLPFVNESFDLVASPSTLDHFHRATDLGGSLREIRRTVSAGGRLVVTLDNRQNIFDPLLRLVIRLGVVPYYIGRSYTVRQLREELESSGWEVLDTTAILHNPRLTATGLVRLARFLRLRWFSRLVQRLLTSAQKLEGTRWQYFSGSFVAALAVPRHRNRSVE
jgi:SAM-dependent methyltransferase